MIVVLAMMLIACTSSQHRAVLDSADSLMNARPDSALTLLNALLPDTDQMRKGDLMRFHLLRTNAENKCDTVLTARHAALMRRVCDYYDHKASPFWGDERGASRMLAHYLLGRCYDDMGEAPAALQEFHNAADAADTTRIDCDFHTLSRIHVQMAYLFYLQDLFEYQQHELKEVIKYSRKCKDFRSELWAFESIAGAHDMMGQKMEALEILQKVHCEYLQKGDTVSAARSLGLLNSIKVDLGLIDGLSQSFREYEQNSGYFDEEGNIALGKGLFYIHKGKYYICLGKRDSAFQSFRKCMNAVHPLETRYAGARELASLYKQCGGPSDSIARYAFLSSILNDSLREETKTVALSRQEKLYNFNRIRQEADHLALQKERVERNHQLWLFISIVILLLLAYICLIWRRKIKRIEKEKREQEMEYEKLSKTYHIALTIHEQVLSDLQKQTDELDRSKEELLEKREIISTRESQLHELQEEITLVRQQLALLRKKTAARQDRRKNLAIDEELERLPILEKIKSCLSSNPPCKLGNNDLQHLRSEVRRVLPSFYDQLVIEKELSLTRYTICILYRLGIKPAHTAILLNLSRSTITMERHRIYEHIFGRKDEEDEFMTFIRSIY